MNQTLSGWCFGATLSLLLVLTGCTLTQLAEPLPTTTPTDPGAALYDANCVTCHGGPTGGQMMDYPPRHNANGHTWHHPDCQLQDTVLNGPGEMGEMMRRMMGVPTTTPRMPAWKGKLSEEEVLAILAYIKTWWTEGQRQQQARATQQAC